MRLNQRVLNRELDALRDRLRRQVPLDDQKREARVERAKSDFRFFCRTYFPHQLSLDGQHMTDPSGLHRWIWDTANSWGPGSRLLLAAPRGNAKTTYMARLYVLWMLCKGETWFTAIIGEALDGAQQNLEVIKVELEDNQRLSADFPAICGMGPVWNQGEIVTCDGRKVKAYGAGKKIRGTNFRGHRPDCIILDDLENDENVKSKRYRDKLEAWFTKAILKLGPPDGSARYLYVGTVLHPDSVLLRVSRRPDFHYVKFKAVIRFPDRMDLWDRWERILGVDADDAREFYDNHPEMNDGAEVLWPDVQPLYSLMIERAADRKAFASEMQNEPLDADTQMFPPEAFTFYVSLPPIVCTVGAVDPGLGKERGDDSAIIVLGRCAANKVHVLEGDVAKYPAMKIIERVISYQKRWNCVRWAIEIVAYQELLMQLLVEQSRTQRIPVPAVGIKPSAAKEIRIESLAPHITNGIILFDPRHKRLIDQLQEYPLGAHDDGPDALEMAFKQIYAVAPMEFKTPGGSGLMSKLRRFGRGF